MSFDYSLNNNIEAAKSSMNDGLVRFEHQDIEQDNSHLKAPPKYIEISWKTYRILGFIFFGLSFAVMKYIVDFFQEKIEDKELMNIVKIVSFFFILNFGTFLFITIYYKYRKSIKGAKGDKGNNGKRGPQGNPSYCNICEKKTGGFRREKKLEPFREEVEDNVLLRSFDQVNEPIWQLLENRIIFNSGAHNEKSFLVMSPSYLGPGKPGPEDIDTSTTVEDKTYPLDNDYNLRTGDPTKPSLREFKPIIGVSATFDEMTGELYSIIFLKDANSKHNSKSYNFEPINDVPFGASDKKGKAVELNCPPNTAIYKIEIFHNGDFIVSMRFFCADIFTGEHKKIVDPVSGMKRKYATIGKRVSKNDDKLNYETVESSGFIHNTKYYPTFICRVAGVYGKSTSSNQKIYALGFLNSCFYQDKARIVQTRVNTLPN
mgnify:CR=1 FL=1